MKKLIYAPLVIVFIFVGFTSNAQSEGFGVKGGLNFSSFDVGGSDTRIGFNFGGFYNQALTGDFSVQPEATLSLEGDDNTSFTNLNLGVMGHLNFEELMVEFGPQLGLILGDDGANASSTNFSVGFGAGYMFSNSMTAGIRYNAGLSDISDGGDVKNNTLSINLFYNL